MTTEEGSKDLPEASDELLFQFAPKIDALVNPPFDSLPNGSDAWALHSAKASVTPLRAAFSEPGPRSMRFAAETVVDEDLRAGRVFKL